jgi:hypothetical protein
LATGYRESLRRRFLFYTWGQGVIFLAIGPWVFVLSDNNAMMDEQHGGS